MARVDQQAKEKPNPVATQKFTHMDEDDDKHGCASSPDTVATDFFTGE